MHTFTAPAPQVVCDAIRRQAVTHFALFDSPAALAAYSQPRARTLSDLSWYGGDDIADAARKAREGDLALVAPSDALLSRFEAFAFATDRKAWTDDVCGSVPNVPAFVAGHPLAMRRRVKTDDEHAPIAIIADLSTSAAIDAKAIARRGAAILALVRVLSQRRPIELWAGTCLDADRRKNAGCVFARIETAPLDLATAAYVLTSASFPRALCYGIARTDMGYCGHWAYDRHGIQQRHAAAIFAPAFAHVARTVVIPAAHANDRIGRDPEGWIAAKLAEIGAVDLNDIADAAPAAPAAPPRAEAKCPKCGGTGRFRSSRSGRDCGPCFKCDGTGKAASSD